MADKRLSMSARRELIRGSARSVFGERGYDHATLNEIARCAGITKSTLYDHLNSKSSFHLELLHEERDVLVDHVAAEVDAAPESYDPIEVAFGAYFSYVVTHPDGWRMLFVDRSVEPAVADALDRIRTDANMGLVEVILEAAGGTFPSLASLGALGDEMVGELVGAGLSQLGQWWLNHPDVARSAVVHAAIAVFWTGLRPRDLIDLRKHTPQPPE